MIDNGGDDIDEVELHVSADEFERFDGDRY